MNDKQFQKVTKALSDLSRFDIFQTIVSKEAGKMLSVEVCENISVTAELRNRLNLKVN